MSLVALAACADDHAAVDTRPGVPCAVTDDCADAFSELRACEVPVCTDGRCAIGAAEDGAECRDGRACTAPDYCLEGQCTGVLLDCDDLDPCTRDECDDKSGCYQVPLSDVACDDGDPCTTGDTCRAGNCGGGAAVDGCCRYDGDCDDQDPCTDDRCGDGACAHVPNRAPCDDQNPCTTADHCDGAGACGGEERVCEDGNPCTDDLCDPATGTCAAVAAETGRPCEDGNACTVDTCADGECVAGPSACECTTDDDCRPLEDDNLCNGTLRCTGTVCELDPLTVVRCNPTGDSACAVAACDPASGQCRPLAADDGLACDDQNPCTTFDHCAAGICQGTPLRCDDDNPCTSDACSPIAGCVFTDNRLACDDGSACTVEDTCADGACIGRARGCDDDNPCTDDTCDDGGGCSHKPNAAACDDGNPCTDSDACAGGVCVGDGDGNCGPCAHDADCAPFEDGDRCNGTLACVGGRCEIAAATIVTCDRTNDTTCRRNRCEPATGLCVARDTADGTGCSDGSPCTSGDTCSGGVCGGAATDCDDGDPCTSDACDPAIGCTHAPRVGACDDGNACTTGDVCNAGGICAGTPRGCNDGNACTVDRCDPLVGCTAVPADDGLPCDDATVCTSGDHCEAGACTGTALVCADTNPCTSDFCSPTNGCFFVASPPDRLCDDGDPCTGGDHCSARICVGAPLTCDDDDPCTDDFCDPARGCSGTAHPDGEACEDGDPCTEGDQCQSGVCQGGAVICVGCNATPCADPGPCTRATCDTASGECLVSPDNEGGVCNDGSVCTLSDHCSGGVCGGTARVCDDGNPCTADLCHPINGCATQRVPLGTPCPDADLCDGTETCVQGQCTGQGTALVCNDDNPCTRNTCVAAIGCSYPAVTDGTTCADADLCDGAENCVAGVCGGGVPKDCDDHNGCTNDACAAATGACTHTIVPGCGPVVACNGPLTTTSQLAGNVFPPVTLAATLSSAGAGGVSYRWEVVASPTGSTAVPWTPFAASSLFQPDLVGEYEIELTVTDGEGHFDTCTTVVTAEPAEAIRIELVWDTPFGDVDLHLASTAASLPGDWFDADEDCFYDSCTDLEGLDWGPNGDNGDVRLDHDDTSGFGPEVADIDAAPAAGTYTVAVSYFCDRNRTGGDSGPTTATVRVTCSGTTTEIGGIELEETGLFTVLGRLSWPSCNWVNARSERYVGEIQIGPGQPQRCDLGCASEDDCLPGESCTGIECRLDTP